jgi:two-component system NtrC family sensor kinase
MSLLRAIHGMSIRAKVLGLVITVMVVSLGVTALVVDRRINRQFEMEARNVLAAADDAFRDYQNFRTKSLLLRFRDVPGQSYYKTAFQAKDAAALREPLNTLLAQQGVDVVLFSAGKQKVLASAKRDPLISTADFEAGSATVVKQALNGEEKADMIRVGEKLYDVVSIPVPDSRANAIGALTLGSEIGGSVADELSRVTHSQVVLLANDRTILSTLPTPDAGAGLVKLFKELASQPGKGNSRWPVREIVIGEEHYFCSGRHFASLDGNSTLGYLLLYSYEQPWRALQTTQQILLGVSSLVILVGSVLVWFLVGKVTQPLRELRTSAEAVGRGDFSRRVKVRYEDECGELARVFNRMTENLKHSREQLEMTVETLKLTQAQLIQSEKLSGIGKFIAGVAHELNNPLTSVMGFSELLRQADVDSKHKRYLDMIYNSAMRCQKIVQALLSFARHRSPERKPACVNGLIEAAVEILQYQLRTSNIEVALHLDPHLPQAMVDPHQIQQVLVNLLNNARQAIEAHQPKGWIKVATETCRQQVRIVIQDSGPGIPEEDLSKIFDPFFTTKEVGKGTGLGLSLCYGIIKEHGGKITPRSKPGEGATFIIELPITQEAAETDDEEPSAEPPAPDRREGAGRKVLVIDDEEPILHMVREMLVPCGYEVDTAADGETGLQRLNEKGYDLALCDCRMPGLSGQQVYERMRVTNPALSERMIFITGDLINEKTRKFLEQQNKICLSKPFTLADFRTAIKQVLSAA